MNQGFAFSDDGACSSQAESFFLRLRRTEFGQRHRIGGSGPWATPELWHRQWTALGRSTVL